MLLNETLLNYTLLLADDSDQTTDINEKYKLNIIVPIAWSLIITGGVLGNGLIIYVILKRRLYINSCTNCYILNVAIADLCFTLICVPVTMTAYTFREWIFGAFMCRFQNLLMFASVQAACLTLTAMTIDRYAAIMYPLKSLDFRTEGTAFRINVSIWIASFTLNIPYFIYYRQTETLSGQDYCYAEFPVIDLQQTPFGDLFKSNGLSELPIEAVLTIYTVIISYFLPLATIIYCYAGMLRKFINKKQPGSDETLSSPPSTHAASLTPDVKFSPDMVSLVKDSEANHENLDKSCIKAKENKKLIIPQFLRGCKRSADETEMAKTLQPQFCSKLQSSTKTNRSEVSLMLSEHGGAHVRNERMLRRQKTRILILIATISITFAILWLPAHVIQIWKVVFRKYFPYSDPMYIAKLIGHTLSYSNSLINPFIYAFVGTKFRHHLYDEFEFVIRKFRPKSSRPRKAARRQNNGEVTQF
nr:G protein-coupled receptor [Proales similis]